MTHIRGPIRSPENKAGFCNRTTVGGLSATLPQLGFRPMGEPLQTAMEEWRVTCPGSGLSSPRDFKPADTRQPGQNRPRWWAANPMARASGVLRLSRWRLQPTRCLKQMRWVVLDRAFRRHHAFDCRDYCKRTSQKNMTDIKGSIISVFNQ